MCIRDRSRRMTSGVHEEACEPCAAVLRDEDLGWTGPETTMLLVLVVGYIGRYFVTVSVYLLSEGIQTELLMNNDEFETLIWTGFVFELFGTLAAGLVADRCDSRKCYLGANYGVAMLALCLGLTEHAWQFKVGWYLIAAGQCGTWASAVKIVSRWFDFSQQGRAIARASMSFLLGDLLARAGVGYMLHLRLSWRLCLQACGLVATAASLPALMFLRSSPADAGLAPRQTISPEQDNLLAGIERPGVTVCCQRLFGSAKFQLVVLLNFLSCGHREFWLTHSAAFLEHAFCSQSGTYPRGCIAGVDAVSAAAFGSALCAAAGVVSALVIGGIKDHCGVQRRGMVLTFLSFAYMLVLGLTWEQPSGQPYTSALLEMVAVSCSMYLVYNYLTSFALDFGGEAATATANGIVLSAGFTGAVAFSVAHERTRAWSSTFGIHALSAVVLLLASTALWHLDRTSTDRTRCVPGTALGNVEDLA
eukprot:TRINITY_DN4210_c0_g1_i2.p1 TRINITY_DN4210_c0_g1~~TRINITY_DN4210_c0_g1_i2.p1  ORF type:complete len:476 (-),score=64.82 TRINITY_DN4210_c0_g1_i2:176-1603(-)